MQYLLLQSIPPLPNPEWRVVSAYLKRSMVITHSIQIKSLRLKASDNVGNKAFETEKQKQERRYKLMEELREFLGEDVPIHWLFLTKPEEGEPSGIFVFCLQLTLPGAGATRPTRRIF